MGWGWGALTETRGCEGERAPEVGLSASPPAAALHSFAVMLGTSLSSLNVDNNFHSILRFWWELECMCSFRHIAWNTGHTQSIAINIVDFYQKEETR